MPVHLTSQIWILDPETNDIVEALRQEMLTFQQLQNLMVHLNFLHKIFIQAFHCEEAEQKLHPDFGTIVPKMQNDLVKFYLI